MLKMMLFLFVLLSQAVYAEKNDENRVGFGAGLGIYYAHSPGLNVTYSIKNIDVIAAVGVNDHWGIATRHYVFGKHGFIQPRIGLFYGTNGDLRTLGENDILKENNFPNTYQGWTLGIGSRLAFGKDRSMGLGIDVGYKLTDGGFNEDSDYYSDNLDHRNHGGEGLLGLGALAGLVGGSYNLQLSVGWEMEF